MVILSYYCCCFFFYTSNQHLFIFCRVFSSKTNTHKILIDNVKSYTRSSISSVNNFLFIFIIFLTIHFLFRVHAPPGGQSSNIFGTEFEQSAANKKKNIGSDIFGTKQDNAEPAPAK